MTNHVRMTTPNVFTSAQRNTPYDIPVFSATGYPGVVISSKWSPQAPLLINSVEIGMSVSEGVARFAILKGFNNKEPDPNNPWDMLMLGGTVAAWVSSDYGKTQTMRALEIPLSTSEWLAVGSYDDENPCFNPSLRFYSELLEQ